MNYTYSRLAGLYVPTKTSQQKKPAHNKGLLSQSGLVRTTSCDDGFRIDPSWMEYNIRRRGSHIYFYEEINEVTQMILEVMLREAINDVLAEHIGDIIEGDLPESVTIHLNSPGGYLSCGFALYDYIKTSQIPITCVVEGICASAATLIMLGCQAKVMSPNSTFLMHQCSWGCWGDNRFMQDNADNAEKAMAKLRKIYADETHLAEGEDEKSRMAYIQRLLEHDFEMSVEECYKYGILEKPDDEDEIDVELSEERVERAHNYIKKLAKEQKKENDEKEAAKQKKPVKKSRDSEKKQATPKKSKPAEEKAAPEKKSEPAKKSKPAKETKPTKETKPVEEETKPVEEKPKSNDTDSKSE